MNHGIVRAGSSPAAPQAPASAGAWGSRRLPARRFRDSFTSGNSWQWCALHTRITAQPIVALVNEETSLLFAAIQKQNEAIKD